MVLPVDATHDLGEEGEAKREASSFRALVEHSPVAVLVVEGGSVVYANRLAATILGHGSGQELVGRGLLEIVHVDDHARLRRALGHEGAPGSVSTEPERDVTGELRVVRGDGATVLLEVEPRGVDWGGRPAHALFARSSSEQRQLFLRLAVADRMQSLGTIAAGLAHEINNPLAYVATNLALLTDEIPRAVEAVVAGGGATTPSLAVVETLLRDAREGAARVTEIVSDLRALSRADHDTRRRVDLRRVIASSIRMAHNEIRHRARVVRKIELGLLPVYANESRLGQVFLNLLINAAHAIPDGHADDNEIRVHAWVADGEKEVIVEIEDTGAGIGPEIIGRIFDPFFTTKPIGVGTGLGLSICHQIVRSLGGAIDVTSAPGKGACFRVTLPVSGPLELDATPPSAPLERGRGRDHDGTSPTDGARVLFIDDERALGVSTSLLLAPVHEVVAVTRAQKALDLIAAGERFDVILCDLMMPEMNGIEFTGELERLAPDYLSRLVFVTGGAFTPESREFLAIAGRPHLEKPFTEQELLQAIEQIRAR